MSEAVEDEIDCGIFEQGSIGADQVSRWLNDGHMDALVALI